MSDLSQTIGFDDAFDSSSSDGLNDQSDSIYNESINGSVDSFNEDLTLTNDTMRFLFVAIATITVLICLTICISVCICICLNRRRRSVKRQETKDHHLLPEQSEKITATVLSISNSTSKTINSNGKQQFDKNILPSSSSSNIIIGKTPLKSYYYDNVDDIPFIDESRPTSFMDITRV